MSTHATGSLSVKHWEEKPYSEIEGGPKLTHVEGINTYSGDIEGEGTLAYLMIYGEKGVEYSGMERVAGRMGGKSGSFILRHTGTYVDGVAKNESSIIPGSATGEFRGISGRGTMNADHEKALYTLDYDFE
ncbi:MAG: uncharacterized protein JWQ98_2717 [Chlorobi bacterium]|nr:uncharacterized protein [Chlorobiota bacterium]